MPCDALRHCVTVRSAFSSSQRSCKFLKKRYDCVIIHTHTFARKQNSEPIQRKIIYQKPKPKFSNCKEQVASAITAEPQAGEGTLRKVLKVCLKLLQA